MSSEDESSQEECALCDKEGYNFDFTPCCHERLCDDCEEDDHAFGIMSLKTANYSTI